MDVSYIVKKDYKVKDSNYEYDYAFLSEDNDEVQFYASKKDDDTYYIKNLAQYDDEWILTDSYKKITVSEDLTVETEGDSSEVKDYFKDYEARTEAEYYGHPLHCYNFEFKNGKCSSIINIQTGC